MKKVIAMLLLLAIVATPAAKLTLKTISRTEQQNAIIAEDEYPYTGTKQTFKK